MKQAFAGDMQEYKALIDPADLQVAIAKSGFGAKALSFLEYARFQPDEVEYKLRLAADLRMAQHAVLNQEGNWRELLKKAIDSPEDNIIIWRLRRPLYSWCEKNGDDAKQALVALWDPSCALGERIDTFAKRLISAGITRPGAQLCLTSVLLMASAPVDCPPVRAKVLSMALEELGMSKVSRTASIRARYDLFMAILDSLIEFSQDYSRPLKNRLEAQGALWCATGGWKNISLHQDKWPTTTDSDEDVVKDIKEAERELEALGESERRAVVAARRGQGRYRNDLLNLWGCCAVTGCTVDRLLRASHLKPWKVSTNAERLNRFNGLLLTPNLDLALDRWLISFTDEGSIIISSSLKADDATALGLRRGMRLQFVKREHKPYLSYHREEFIKREESLKG